LFRETNSLLPHYVEDVNQERKIIKLNPDGLQTIKINGNVNYEFYTPKEEYRLHVYTSENLSFVNIDFQPVYLLDLMELPEIVFFFKQGIQALKEVDYAYVSGIRLRQLTIDTYRDFDFSNRGSLFTGFTWLLYLNNEEVEKNGGDALLTIPHLTNVERLPDGVLFQVGESPLDVFTPEGEQQLYLATKAWCEIVGCSEPLFKLPNGPIILE
ncbi:MAG: hypothetical protein AAFX87_24065, partial [Bacteroidota bacterium]